MLCISSSSLSFSLIPSVECAGSSGILVDPANPFIPTIADFFRCQGDTKPCDGYYCPNGFSCSQRTCIGNNYVRDMPFPEFTVVPTCIETTKLSLTAAIAQKTPKEAMYDAAIKGGVLTQMVVLSTTTSSKRVDEIIPKEITQEKLGVSKDSFKAYDIELGFFSEKSPTVTTSQIIGDFVKQLRKDGESFVDAPNLFSTDGKIGALVNTSDIQITSATFQFQRCSDGTAVSGSDTCPPEDPALIAATSAATTTSSTTRLLTIILPIVGGIVGIALIIAMILIIRRRRANKVMRQTVQHTELAAQPTMP